MSFSTITGKGQITIPNQVRAKLNLKPGDKIEFRHAKDEAAVYFVPWKNKTREVFGMLSRKGEKALSTEDMDHAIAERVKKEYQ